MWSDQIQDTVITVGSLTHGFPPESVTWPLGNHLATQHAGDTALSAWHRSQAQAATATARCTDGIRPQDL